jgi:DNA replication protein DnaC
MIHPYDELMEQVKNTPLLILDDLSPESATPWARDKLEQILNHRFNRRLPTIVNTDILIERLDERLRSRILDRDVTRLFVLEDRRSVLLEQLDAMEQKLLRGMTFEKFERRRLNLPPEQQQSLAQAYNLAFNFARSPQGWLVLQGESGCGKTPPRRRHRQLPIAIGQAGRLCIRGGPPGPPPRRIQPGEPRVP